MRYIKILLLAFCALALSFGGASAGLNPQDPGLGGGLAAYNPNLSKVCIECHGLSPVSTTTMGSHFVFNPTIASPPATRSGGGWTGAVNGARTGGQYFRVTNWYASPNQTFSKYGNSTDNTNRYTAVAADNAGMAISTANASTYGGYQLICESCHSVVRNVAGGNNLVAPLSASAYATSTMQSAQVVDTVGGGGQMTANESTLCVGCHGFMYNEGVIESPAQTRRGDTRNTADIAPGNTLRGNNHTHSVNTIGQTVRQNHHVMTGDVISASYATSTSVVLWRDTVGVPNDMNGVTAAPGAGEGRGQMPQRATWADGKYKAGSTETNISCVHCHSVHTGNYGTGASILRDTNVGGTATASTQRLGEGTRAWFGTGETSYNDALYCNDCHRVK